MRTLFPFVALATTAYASAVLPHPETRLPPFGETPVPTFAPKPSTEAELSPEERQPTISHLLSSLRVPTVKTNEGDRGCASKPEKETHPSTSPPSKSPCDETKANIPSPKRPTTQKAHKPNNEGNKTEVSPEQLQKAVEPVRGASRACFFGWCELFSPKRPTIEKPSKESYKPSKSKVSETRRPVIEKLPKATGKATKEDNDNEVSPEELWVAVESIRQKNRFPDSNKPSKPAKRPLDERPSNGNNKSQKEGVKIHVPYSRKDAANQIKKSSPEFDILASSESAGKLEARGEDRHSPEDARKKLQAEFEENLAAERKMFHGALGSALENWQGEQKQDMGETDEEGQEKKQKEDKVGDQKGQNGKPQREKRSLLINPLGHTGRMMEEEKMRRLLEEYKLRDVTRPGKLPSGITKTEKERLFRLLVHWKIEELDKEREQKDKKKQGPRKDRKLGRLFIG